MSTSRDRQQTYRERRRRQGHKAITVWLDSTVSAILERQARAYTGDRSDRLAAVISDALHAWDTVTSNNALVTSNKPVVTSNRQYVTSNVTSNGRVVTSNKAPVTSNVTSNTLSPAGRYMPQVLEDHILALRQSGLSLSATAKQLAAEGHLNAKGALYSTATVSKAATRAKVRLA